jgi:uncharacterized protein
LSVYQSRSNPGDDGAGEHGAADIAVDSAADSAADIAVVTALLGRRPRGAFEVVVRDEHGGPVVIRNAPFLDDGKPMPTRYWLVGRRACEEVGRLESTGAIDRIEAELGPQILAATHERYARERNLSIDPTHVGPKPAGGVGGTRVGVKCLHAHYAWFLAGGDDPVGSWVDVQLRSADNDPATER